jgi:hypothetical protein
VVNYGSRTARPRFSATSPPIQPKASRDYAEVNRGYGGALRVGSRRPTKDLVIYTDGDASTKPANPTLLERMDAGAGWEWVQAQRHDPCHRSGPTPLQRLHA